MKILVNHLGYSARGPKKAVFQGKPGDNPQKFCLVNEAGKEVFRGEPQKHGEVANWKTGFYWTADFSPVEAEGRYTIQAETGNGTVCSDVFEIRLSLLTMRMISAVGYYFKAQRSAGEWLYSDRDLPFFGERQGRIDAHGGWFDATGDYGIHFSHLSHSTLHNPQQIPFTAYALFKVHEFLEQSGNEEYSMVKRRMLDEASFGVDHVMRMRAPGGSFFRSINRKHAFTPVAGSRGIGFEYHGSSSQFSPAATADEETIGDENYECSLRSGAGLAIASLAIAGRHYYPGRDFSTAEYIAAARDAWKHLETNNEKYTNDGEWNLIDEYCALIALTELFISTGEFGFLEKCREMYDRIKDRVEDMGDGTLRLTIKPGIPFHHAADEGMPLAALVQYAAIEPRKERKEAVIKTAEGLMRRLLHISQAVTNPFGYPRFEHKDTDGGIKAKFFFPHNTTAAPWWQGENARIASLASAALLLAQVTDAAFAGELRRFAQNILDWIMGLNPFDSCMIEGYGKNNIQYFFKNRYDFLNCPGGIVNGITSGLEDEESIGYVTEPGGPIDDNWRWAEQWIPHASWYLYAMALKLE
jgi:hypothetical protein